MLVSFGHLDWKFFDNKNDFTTDIENFEKSDLFNKLLSASIDNWIHIWNSIVWQLSKKSKIII